MSPRDGDTLRRDDAYLDASFQPQGHPQRHQPLAAREGVPHIDVPLIATLDADEDDQYVDHVPNAAELELFDTIDRSYHHTAQYDAYPQPDVESPTYPATQGYAADTSTNAEFSFIGDDSLQDSEPNDSHCPPVRGKYPREASSLGLLAEAVERVKRPEGRLLAEAVERVKRPEGLASATIASYTHPQPQAVPANVSWHAAGPPTHVQRPADLSSMNLPLQGLSTEAQPDYHQSSRTASSDASRHAPASAIHVPELVRLSPAPFAIRGRSGEPLETIAEGADQVQFHPPSCAGPPLQSRAGSRPLSRSGPHPLSHAGSRPLSRASPSDAPQHMSRAGSHPLSRAGRSDAPQHASTSGSMYSNQRISADLARLTATHGGATSIPVAIGIAAPSETINARASPIEPGTPQRHLTINIEPPTSQYRGGQDGPQFTFLAPNIAPLNPEEHRHMMELLPPSSPLAEDDDAVGSPDNALEDGHSDVSLDDILDAEHILEQPEKIRKYSVNANSEPQIDEEKQKMRRIAGERRKKIIQEVLAVDDLFKNIADNHGVHPEQVRAIWGNLHRRGRHRKSNLWTLYQVYHSTFSEQECRRWLKPDADGKIEVSDNRDAVSRCFEGFKNHYKDRENVMWDILSTTYDMNLLLHGKGRTVGGHKRMFTEWSHEISSQLLLGHKQNGFESVLIAGGGSTFQDDSLGVVWESPGAEGVLQRIFGTSDKSVILGHLRAQGMMYNSQQANVNVRGGEMMNIAGPSNTATEVPVDVANPSNVVDASGTGDAQEAFKSPQISATELAVPGAKATKDDVLKYLRTRFIDLILTAKGEEIQPNATVPWTTAYPQLRDGNLIIENWPEDVPYPKPGDKKGIAVLSGLERQRLLHAFLDTEYPLRCVPGGHLNKANPTNYLAIVGVPPKSSSIHTGGLRVWYSKLNAKVWGDFHGAPRLKRVHPMPADFNGDNDSSKPPIVRRPKRRLPAVESEDDKSGRPSADAEQAEVNEIDNSSPKPKRVRINPAAKRPTAPASKSHSSHVPAARGKAAQHREHAPPPIFYAGQTPPTSEEDQLVSSVPPARGVHAKHTKSDSSEIEVLDGPPPQKTSVKPTKLLPRKTSNKPRIPSTDVEFLEGPPQQKTFNKSSKPTAPKLVPVVEIVVPSSMSRKVALSRLPATRADKAAPPASSKAADTMPTRVTRGMAADISAKSRTKPPIEAPLAKRLKPATSLPMARMTTPVDGPSDGSPIKKGKGLDRIIIKSRKDDYHIPSEPVRRNSIPPDAHDPFTYIGTHERHMNEHREVEYSLPQAHHLGSEHSRDSHLQGPGSIPQPAVDQAARYGGMPGMGMPGMGRHNMPVPGMVHPGMGPPGIQFPGMGMPIMGYPNMAAAPEALYAAFLQWMGQNQMNQGQGMEMDPTKRQEHQG